MRPDATHRTRLGGWAGAALGTLGISLLLAALVIGYADRALFDSGQFAARAAAALENPAVQEQVALAVTDDVVLPARRDLVAVRPLIQSTAQQVVGGSAFRSLFRASVADVHRSLFDRDASTVTLTVANLGIVLQAALERLDPSAAGEVRRDVEILSSKPPSPLLSALQGAEDVRALTIWLTLLALLALAGALTLSRDRRESLRRGGIGLAAGALLLLVVYWVAQARLLGRVEEPDLRAALQGVWDAYLLDLRNLLVLIAGCAAVVAAAAASLLRPMSFGALPARAWEAAVRVPQRPWLRAARAVALIVAGLLVATDPLAALRLVALALGIALIYAGVQELLRVVSPAQAESPAPASRRLLSRNAVVATGGAALAIVVAGSLFLATGGVSYDELVPSGCNGHDELCERRLDEVAIAATHNSFSAADYPRWLFAQQERGIAAQLDAGVRGFLIDTHWGRSAPDGAVITDLAEEGNVAREELVQEFGAEVVDAALRVRDSISGRAARDGPRAIYMCHGFCEVGARLLRTDLEAMRDFLYENPNEVVVIINQNEGVSPTEFAAVVEDAGLDDLAYGGPTDELPTLGEMVDSNERVLLMAENPPFGEVPWYHEAYALTQETPFRFNRPAQLTDPAALESSCEPNRGPADAPLFLINHWIDTSPAPRPSNAAKVNARRPLLRRTRTCERQRGLTANLLAVDFYETGDLFAVVDELNGVE